MSQVCVFSDKIAFST